jgi:hypothetical protein
MGPFIEKPKRVLSLGFRRGAIALFGVAVIRNDNCHGTTLFLDAYGFLLNPVNQGSKMELCFGCGYLRHDLNMVDLIKMIKLIFLELEVRDDGLLLLLPSFWIDEPLFSSGSESRARKQVSGVPAENSLIGDVPQPT